MNQEVTPSRPPRLSAWAVDQLLDKVISSGLEPGDVLPTERQLASQLGISRNVIRQAFRVLEARGLVRSQQGSGRYLRQVPEQLSTRPSGSRQLEIASIADVLEARLVLEQQMAVLACQRRTLAEAEDLSQLAMRLETWQDNNAFHMALAAATHNFMLERLLSEQMSLLEEMRQRDFYQRPEMAQVLLSEHRALADAVLARNAQRAQELVRQHLLHTIHTVGVEERK